VLVWREGTVNSIWVIPVISGILILGLIGFSQEAFAGEPQFLTYVADDPDNADEVLSAGDILTITFNEATNATAGAAISQAEINLNFTDGGDGSYFEDIVNYEGKSEWIEIGSDRILFYLADHQDQINIIDVLSRF